MSDDTIDVNGTWLPPRADVTMATVLAAMPAYVRAVRVDDPDDECPCCQAGWCIQMALVTTDGASVVHARPDEN